MESIKWVILPVLFLATTVTAEVCVDEECYSSESIVQVYRYSDNVRNSLDKFYEEKLMHQSRNDLSNGQSCISLWRDKEFAKAISLCEQEAKAKSGQNPYTLVLVICYLKTNQIQKAWDLLSFLHYPEQNAALYLLFDQIYAIKAPLPYNHVYIYETVYDLVEELYTIFNVRNGLRFLGNNSKWHMVYKLTQIMLANIDEIDKTKNNNNVFWDLVSLSTLASNNFHELAANLANAPSHQLKNYRQLAGFTNRHRKVVQPEAKVDLSLPENQRKYYFSVCVIFKHERENLIEFIEYSLMTGMEHFFLIANVNDNTYQDILQTYVDEGIVEFLYVGDLVTQTQALDICVMKNWKKTHWMAITDVDEFIVTSDGRDIPSVLREYDAFDGLYLSWKSMCTPVGMETQSDLLIERVVHSLDGYETSLTHDRGKIILNTVYGRDMLEDGLDHCRYKQFYVDEHNHIMEKEPKYEMNNDLCGKVKWTFGKGNGYKHNPFLHRSSTILVTQRSVSQWDHYHLFPPIHDVLYINHYVIKTQAEFVAKANRGYSWFITSYGPDRNKWPQWAKERTCPEAAKRLAAKCNPYQSETIITRKVPELRKRIENKKK